MGPESHFSWLSSVQVHECESAREAQSAGRLCQRVLPPSSYLRERALAYHAEAFVPPREQRHLRQAIQPQRAVCLAPSSPERGLRWAAAAAAAAAAATTRPASSVDRTMERLEAGRRQQE